MLGAMIWEYRHDNDEGTLRHAVKHAMDGNPDKPGKYERPDEYVPPTPAQIPVMGKVEFSKKLQSSDGKWVPELSGLCLSKDGDFLWGVNDNGGLYRINFDGSFSLHWDKSAEMEGLAMDPATGTIYIGLEDSSNSGYVVPAPGYNAKTNFGWVVDGASGMGNSGVEGIAWYKGELLLGTQTGATLYRYTLDGKLQEKKSLRTVCSTISEIAGLDYDEKNDWLWVIDSNSNKDKPQYDPYTIYLFDGAATKLLAKYYIGDFADWNPEAICVDRKNGCIWVGEDCGDEKFSILHKIQFSGL
jgi:sugar lactone lactonase YvrE